MDVSVVIPTWNGAALLRRFLPSVLREVEHYRKGNGGDAEVIVVDDASVDDTVEFLRQLPVRVVTRPTQGGFACACNSGIDVVRFSCVVLLNNDVEVAPGFISAMLEPFDDDQIFAVTARIYEPENGLLATAGKIGIFRRGFWSVYFNYDVLPGAARFQPSAYAVGGFCALRTTQMRLLGGFDEMLSPFHWEDVDLSYRAWKRGWSVVYQPQAVGWHQASSTIGRTFQSREVEIVAARNRLLFHWKNLHDPVMLSRHVSMLALLLFSRWVAGDWGFYQAFWQALSRWSEWRGLRRQEKLAIQRPDGVVRELLRRFARRSDIQVYRSRRDVEERHECLRSSDHTE